MRIKWKSLIISCAFCLVPIIIGVLLWDKLPETMAVHFNINNEADNFASKGFVVFGIPLLMMLLQVVCCVVSDANKDGETKKLETVTIWIIPAITIFAEIIMFAYALGILVDIRRFSSVVVGLILVILGKCLPNFDYVKNYKLDKEDARKINKFMGHGTVVLGLVLVASACLPPLFSIVGIVLLIIFAIVMAGYAMKLERKKKF